MLLLSLLLPGASAFEGVRPGATWAYDDSGLAPDGDWALPGYDASAWATGLAPLGFGRDETTTVTNHGGLAWYYRATFEVDDPGAVADAFLDIAFDDGAVVYLNGTEVGRWRMPAGTVTETTAATGPTAAPDERPAQPVDTALLVAGENVLAVEIHQASTTSSDTWLDLQLTLAPHVLAGPWAIPLSPTRMRFAWESYADAPGTVEYGTTAAYGASASDAGGTRHFVDVSGLPADTLLHFRVSGAGYTSDDRALPTPPDDPTAPLRFGVYGDSRTNPDIHGGIAAHLAAEDPTFVIHTGDFVDDPEDVADWYRDVFDPAEPILAHAGWLPVPGNHESEHDYPDTLYWDWFPEAAGAPWWATTLGPARFIFLDSNDPDFNGENGDPTASAQWAFLEGELAAATEDFVFVAQHHPAWSSGRHAPDADVQTFQAYLAPLLEAYGVTALLAGHDHRYERSYHAGTHYFTLGGGGATLHGPCHDASPPDDCVNPYSQYAVNAFNYGVIEIADGEAWALVYGDDGALLEDPVLLTDDPPLVEVVAPDGVCDTVDDALAVAWVVDDPDSEPTLAVYADTDGTGCDGVLLGDGYGPDDAPVVDTSTLGEGSWYVYVVASDAVNASCAYADGPVRVSHPSATGAVLLPMGSTWSYFATGVAPSGNWTRPFYPSAAGWPSGCGELGYGDGDEATTVPATAQTVYFRTTFAYAGEPTTQLLLEAALDDGATVYLNGRQVGRRNMPAGVPTYATYATAPTEGSPTTTIVLNAAALGFLTVGTNTLAVEVHQASATSSDLSWDARVIAVP